MKISIQLIFISLLICSFEVSLGQPVQPAGAVEISYSAGGNTNTVKMPPKVTEGTYYLADDWKQGVVYLSSGQALNQFLIKYDIEHLLIELKSLVETKIVYAMTVDSFTVNDTDFMYPRKYINASFFNFPNTTLGFLEMLSKGKITLLSRIELGVQMGYYLPSHGVGNQNDEIIKLEKFYIVRDGEIRKLPKAPKDIMPIFKDQRPALRAYIKANKLKIRKRADLIKMVDYYNSL